MSERENWIVYYQTHCKTPEKFFKPDSAGDTFLHVLVCNEGVRDEVVSTMIAPLNGEKCDWDARNNKNQTILLLAVVLGKPVTVAALIQKGASNEFLYKNGENIFHVACKLGRKDCLVALLQNATNAAENESNLLNAANHQGRAPVHVAAEADNLSCVQLLLDKGVNVDTQMMDGNTCLHIGISQSKEGLVKELLGRGASLDIKNNLGVTPIVYSKDAQEKEKLKKHHNAIKTRKRRQESRRVEVPAKKSNATQQCESKNYSQSITAPIQKQSNTSVVDPYPGTITEFCLAAVNDLNNSAASVEACTLQPNDYYDANDQSEVSTLDSNPTSQQLAEVIEVSTLDSNPTSQQLAEVILAFLAMKPESQEELAEKHSLLDQYYLLK